MVGDDNTVTQSNVTLGGAPSNEELQQLREQFAALKAMIAEQAPAELQQPAADRIEELEEAVNAEEPDLSTMEYVKKWFVKNLPSFAGAVTSVVVNPIVGKLVGVAGDALTTEFKKRFGVED